MQLSWTKHAVVQGYKRLGRYGLDEINSRIIQNVDRATVTSDGRAKVSFKMGRKKCVAILKPLNKNGLKALVVTVWGDSPRSAYDFGNPKRQKKHDLKLRQPMWQTSS